MPYKMDSRPFNVKLPYLRAIEVEEGPFCSEGHPFLPPFQPQLEAAVVRLSNPTSSFLGHLQVLISAQVFRCSLSFRLVTLGISAHWTHGPRVLLEVLPGVFLC